MRLSFGRLLYVQNVLKKLLVIDSSELRCQENLSFASVLPELVDIIVFDYIVFLLLISGITFGPHSVDFLFHCHKRFDNILIDESVVQVVDVFHAAEIFGDPFGGFDDIEVLIHPRAIKDADIPYFSDNLDLLGANPFWCFFLSFEQCVEQGWFSGGRVSNKDNRFPFVQLKLHSIQLVPVNIFDSVVDFLALGRVT